ncbi:MAG: BatD family protein [Pseudomonadales bacterium]|nr:BatD family protein [Pseudomonadales bacterium]
MKINQSPVMTILRNCLFLICSVMVLSSIFSTPSNAATAELRANQGPPYYAGVPVELIVSAEGFNESPQPQLEFVDPKGGKLVLVGVSPNISSSIQIINGNMTRSKTVLFNYHLRFTATKSGKYTIGPFKVTQGITTVEVGAGVIEVGSIPKASHQKIKLVLPEGNIYVGQRLSVKLKWWVKLSTIENLMNPQAHVPLFNLNDVFQFYEYEDTGADNQLTIDDQVYPASVEKVDTDEGMYAVWTVERLMVPLKPGEYNIEPASLSVDEGIRWRRDFFGRRSASQLRKLRTVDKRRTLTIKDLPLEGRPASYAGAVGRGFALDVAADRSVVQVGDPIKLILTLKGDVEVAKASLPVLSEDLPVADFRVPSGKIAGVYDGETKQFEISIRVLNDTVREIPPISYSWFDTKLQKYQTTQSRPIALSVRAAQMVSASDVVRSSAGKEDEGLLGAGGSAHTQSSSVAGKTARQKSFSLSGADLSISKDQTLLLGSEKSWLGTMPQQISSYVIAFMLIAIAVILRQRSELDPEILARQKKHKEQCKRIEKGVNLKELSDAVRRMAAVATDVPRLEVDQLLAECDARVFAPGGAGVGVDDSLKKRALALAQQMAPATRGIKQ